MKDVPVAKIFACFEVPVVESIALFHISPPADFEFCAIRIPTIFAFGVARLRITDAGSGRDLFTDPVHMRNMMTTNGNPFLLPRPYLFRSQASVSVSILDEGAKYDTEILFMGLHVYRLDGH